MVEPGDGISFRNGTACISDRKTYICHGLFCFVLSSWLAGVLGDGVGLRNCITTGWQPLPACLPACLPASSYMYTLTSCTTATITPTTIQLGT